MIMLVKQDVHKWAYHQRDQKAKGLLSEEKLKKLNEGSSRWKRGITNFLCLEMSYAKRCRGKLLEDICCMVRSLEKSMVGTVHASEHWRGNTTVALILVACRTEHSMMR